MISNGIPLSRRDRFVFQYPPFAAMQAGQSPDFSVPGPKDEGFQLYVHIPFCAVRCTFCYYGIMPNTFRSVVDPYVEALHREIDMVAELPYLQGRKVETIYFGGGTPTYLKEPQLERLITHLKERFDFADGYEFTSEGEPTTITESKLQLLKDHGVTRMSFGVQSFHPDIATLNGRIAKPHVVERTLRWAKDIGFRVVNVDLMSAMLGETMETWRHSIDKVLEVEPQHITIYRMEIKPGTQFYTKLQFDPELRKTFVSDDLELEMIDHAEARFAEHGYQHHTHFSWVREREFEHTHRNNCWHGRDLIALGESAFGYANGYLYQNANPYRPYTNIVSQGKQPVARAHKLTLQERMTGYMTMGFKLLKVSRVHFRTRFGADPLEVFPREIEALEQHGAIEIDEEMIRVTEHGCYYADSFLKIFYQPEYRDMDELCVGTPPFHEMPTDIGDISALLAGAVALEPEPEPEAAEELVQLKVSS